MEPRFAVGEDAYRRVVERARRDPAVVGMVLTGSRGRNVHVRPESDWDVRLIVRDEAVHDARERYGTARGGPLDVFVLPLSGFPALGAPGTADEWDRYSYVHVPAVLDKLDGGIARLLADKATLPGAQAHRMAADALDAYINAYHRSLKNDLAGLTTEAHLDAAESLAHLLDWLFATHQRVRPFSRFLRWELERHPLPGSVWSADSLIPRLGRIAATGSSDEQASLFREVEGVARAHDLGDVIDAWEPDVAWLRSGKEKGDRAPVDSRA